MGFGISMEDFYFVIFIIGVIGGIGAFILVSVSLGKQKYGMTFLFSILTIAFLALAIYVQMDQNVLKIVKRTFL